MYFMVLNNINGKLTVSSVLMSLPDVIIFFGGGGQGSSHLHALIVCPTGMFP